MFGRICNDAMRCDVAKMIVALSCPRDDDKITGKLRLWIPNQKLHSENLQHQIDRYFISIHSIPFQRNYKMTIGRFSILPKINSLKRCKNLK